MAMIIVHNFWTLNEKLYNLETYTLLRGKALADYQLKVDSNR